MDNLDFIKTLSILYVEDSSSIRKLVEDKISRLFKNFYVAEDGKEALEKYNELKKNNKKPDVIFSDINMPNMDGLEFLEKIREEDFELPFLFTTAHFEKDYLKRAIDLNANEYILKPINIKDALNKIARECKVKNQNEALKHQKEELESYLKAIDNVATVNKMNLEGNIIFANKLFCEVSQYSLKELINQPITMIRHPDMPSKTYEIIWETIQSGKTWKGKLKNKAKDGSAYYATTTIIPRYDENGKNIIEYISIRFITTEDELEKREFKKKVMQNIKDSRKEKVEKDKYIKSLEDKIKNSNLSLNEQLYSSLNNERKRISKLHSQILHYETEIKKTNTKYEKMIESSNDKIKKAFIYAKRLKNENEKFIFELGCVKDDLEEKKKSLAKLQEIVTSQQKIIDDLRDVISHREEQLENRKKL